jgi:uncharacterized membrane protein YphA (DoxX/SURF4 family)
MSSSLVPGPSRGWKLFALLARLIVGGLFVVSAVGKIMDPGAFADEVRDYQMLPVMATNIVAYLLPWLECFAGLMLMTTFWRKEACGIIATLLIVFTCAKAWTYTQGIDIRGCGCSGGLAVLDYIYDTPQGILTNVVMLALLWADYRVQRLKQRLAEASRVAGPPVRADAGGDQRA